MFLPFASSHPFFFHLSCNFEFSLVPVNWLLFLSLFVHSCTHNYFLIILDCFSYLAIDIIIFLNFSSPFHDANLNFLFFFCLLFRICFVLFSFYFFICNSVLLCYVWYIISHSFSFSLYPFYTYCTPITVCQKGFYPKA